MLLLVCLTLPVAFGLIPASHPMHSAPPALLNRITSSGNAAALLGHGSDRDHNRVVFNQASTGHRVSPTEFGGDPTGVKDSTDALNKALAVCLNQSALSPNGLFPGSRSFNNGHAVRDMGGCFIDLAGGEYLISSPLVIPEYNANMILGMGSLVASPSFSPVDGFMIVIGIQGSCKVPQGSCNIDINFPELFMDGSHVASTMQINNVMGVTIGPGGYFLNFTKYGIQINQGHEVMVDRCWLGETNFDFDYTKEGTVPNASAIQINGNDHYVMNTIVFSSRIGLEVHGAADFIKGVHVWFPDNRALAFMNPPVSAKAFYVTAGGNRFDGCYADGGRVVFEGGGLSRNIWTNGFECCAGGGLGDIHHGIILSGDKVGPGLEIHNNLFNGGSIWHESSANAIQLQDRQAAAAAVLAQGTINKAKCDASSFPYNLSGIQCDGLTSAPRGDSSAQDCEQACCDLQAEGSCTMWQWCNKTNDPTCGCWVDSTPNEVPCAKARSGGPWFGASIAAPPVPSASVTDVNIANNVFGTLAVGSRASGSISASQPTDTFHFDFCSQLIFPQITLVRSLTFMSAKAVHGWALPPSGCKLTVMTNTPMQGTVFVEVDTSNYGGNLV